MITKENLAFLSQLAKNNNRDWFNENKVVYQQQHENTIAFADEVLALMQKHDNIQNESGKKSLMRIYRDVRFSKDKSPYKTNWAVFFERATKQLRGGYYVHIQPGEVFVGGGFWKPESTDMKLIRDGMINDEQEIRAALSDPMLLKQFGKNALHGEQLKNVPRGYDKESSVGDLLRYKQFLFRKDFTDEQAMSPDFPKKVNEAFKGLRPFFDWMSYTLTHDANGEPLYTD